MCRKEDVCLCTLDTWAGWGRLFVLNTNIHLPKPVAECLYYALLHSASKGQIHQKDDFWLNKDISGEGVCVRICVCRKQPLTHPLESTYVEQSLHSGEGEMDFGLVFRDFSVFSSKATPHPADSTQTPRTLISPNLQRTGRHICLA